MGTELHKLAHTGLFRCHLHIVLDDHADYRTRSRKLFNLPHKLNFGEAKTRLKCHPTTTSNGRPRNGTRWAILLPSIPTRLTSIQPAPSSTATPANMTLIHPMPTTKLLAIENTIKSPDETTGTRAVMLDTRVREIMVRVSMIKRPEIERLPALRHGIMGTRRTVRDIGTRRSGSERMAPSRNSRFQ